jgi:hypothetical protein
VTVNPHSAQDVIPDRSDAFIPACIQPGAYVVQTRRAVVLSRFDRRTLQLICEVVEPPAFDGVELSWYATLPSSGDRPAAGSKFARAWVLVMGRRPHRGERPSLRDLVGKRLRVVVETVTRSWERDELKRPVPLPAEAQYSVIRTLVDRA